MSKTNDIKAFTAVVGAFTLYIAYYSRGRLDLRRLLSSRAEANSHRTPISVDVIRDNFSQTVFAPLQPVQGHTHPTAALLRSSATSLALKISALSGGRIYSLSMSKSDQRKSIAGERQWFWAKDTNADNQQDARSPNDVLYLCDVDYYVDMNTLLIDNENPVMVYTVVPEDAASDGKDDTTFYFEEDGSLTTLIAGGGRYNHHLWDYATDSLMVKKTFMGFAYRATTYSVERIQLGYSRQLILLAPMRVFTGIGAWFATFVLPVRQLARFRPVLHTIAGSFARFVVHRSNGTFTTTARTGSLLCATVPSAVDDAVATSARLGAANLQLPTAMKWIGDHGRKEAAVLTEYHRSSLGEKSPTVYPIELSVRSYTFGLENYDVSRRAKLSAFMSPLVHGAFCPINDEASEKACVKGRINDLKKPEPKPNPFVDNCMLEFCELVVGGACLEPASVDDVVSKQTRPAQKTSLARAMVAGPYEKRILKCFIKAEAYQDVKDPRNISQYNDRDKLSMAMFAIALSNYCKKFSWYGPGKTPVEIAERVRDICQSSLFVNQSDYHRMDGTITKYLREVDRMIFMRAFPEFRPQLNELLKTNYDNKGILPFGTTFNQGSSHGSGCSATSVSQTLRSTFAAYLGFRHTFKPNGQYYSPREAFDAIGIHLGDDGLDGDLPCDSHKWAATRVGLILEASAVRYGEPGVSFLARYYSPEVWSGSLDSMCDVKRQLSKFHTTVRLPANVKAEDKLVEKCRGYFATDSNTPVIGEIASKVVDLAGYEHATKFDIAPWWSRFDFTVQFPNNNVNGWMDAEFERQFPEFDRKLFNLWLRRARNLPDILEAPLCCEIEPPTPRDISIVVDGDVIPPKPTGSKNKPPPVAQTPKQERVIRKSDKSPTKSRGDRR